MKPLRTAVALASLLFLAAPLPVALLSAIRVLSMTAVEASAHGAHAPLTSSMSAYAGATLMGFVGFILAGFCLDGFGMRSAWYLRSLVALGVLWLGYFPLGTIFGACLLFYLLMKHLAERRSAERESQSRRVD